MTPESKKEERRLAALRETGLMGTLPEAAFDEIARLAAQICGTPIALVSLIGEDRQWFKSRVGLSRSETPRELAFCDHAISAPQHTMVVEDAARDARFASHPLVQGEPRIRFYAGAPIVTHQGDALGTLCVIDRVPRTLSPAQLDALESLRDQLQAQIELRRQTRKLRVQEQVIRKQLEELRELQLLKDDLVSMIVHDLRNPLAAAIGFVDLAYAAAVRSGRPEMVEFLSRAREAGVLLGDRIEALLEVRLIEHHQLQVQKHPVPARQLMEDAVRTIAAHGGDRIPIEIQAGETTLRVDEKLVRRAVENLLSNALKYTELEDPVLLTVSEAQDGIAIEVADRGPGVPDAFKEVLFEKFGSVEARKGATRRGIGLGLYLVKLVADLHGGAASVRDRQGGGAIFRLWFPR